LIDILGTDSKAKGISLPPDMKKKFAVVRMWPGLQTAEREVIARLKISAKLLGLDCIEIDSSGYCIKTGKAITSNEVDFAIHLHFETPKNYDIFSFVALWNPLQFYFDFGYEIHSKNLISHDDFLSCLSPGADDHVKRLLARQPLHLPPKFTMFHSVPGPVIAPVSRQRNLFYIGINWEKLGQGKSRHEALLKELDRTDYLRIHGPRVFQGVKIWKGFKSYVGEIPFDGVSVSHAINSVGAGLVLSSEAHRASGLMSNRLFETIAAGSVVICDENPFARKHFGDTLLYVDSEAEDLFSQVDKHMSWINANPDQACELVMRAQKVFLKDFQLMMSLRSMYEGLRARKEELSFSLDPSSATNPKVILIGILTDENIESEQRLIESCIRQSYRNLHLVVVVDEKCSRIDVIDGKLQNSKASYRIVKQKSLYKKIRNNAGFVISQAIKSIKSDAFDAFTILLSHEEIFCDHISSQMRIFMNQKAPQIVATSANLLSQKTHKETNKLQSAVKLDWSVYSNPIGFARFMFPKRVIREEVFYLLPYLDKRCFVALVGEEEVVASALVTGQINWDDPIFRERLSEDLETLLINDVFPSELAEMRRHAPQRSVLNFISGCIKGARDVVARTPMPLRLRLVLRKWYRKLRVPGS